VGYYTLSEPGLILEANLTVAKMLGVARGALVTQPLSRFVVREDQDIYYLHHRALLVTGAPQRSEFRMLKQDAPPFWARVEATIARGADGTSVYRTVVSDITESKRVEQLIQTHVAELQEFAYALTHDLQEPLRMVVAFNQLLAKAYAGKLGGDANNYIAYSLEGALRIEAVFGMFKRLHGNEIPGTGIGLALCKKVVERHGGRIWVESKAGQGAIFKFTIPTQSPI
jgi:PAS domain S-box-containing protein